MKSHCGGCGQAVTVRKGTEFCPHCGHKFKGDDTPAIQLDAVSKSYGGNEILRNLSLTVHRGECLVVVGMSGSGKSVLLDHIIGFQKPDHGRVIVSGVVANDSASHSPAVVPSEIGMVFQGSALLDSLTVLDNVELPLTIAGPVSSADRQRAGELLTAVGLPRSCHDRLPSQLSGGMQKRVGVARALITEPSIILYDEPTTGLDAATSTTISKLIRSVQVKKPDLTSIVITHDYLSAGYIADRVLFLNRNTGQLQSVMSREDIEEIRNTHGSDSARTVGAIREHLESYFSKLSTVPVMEILEQRISPWSEVLMSIVVRPIKIAGTTITRMMELSAPRFNTLFFRRVNDIGVLSLPVAASAGAFFGMMLAVQLALGMLDSGILDPLPKFVGSALIDKVGPLVVGLLLAGRVAASVSAEIGGKRLSRQFDACRAMSISPEVRWLSPIFWASVVSLPLLTIALEGSAIAGAWFVSVVRYHVKSSFFLSTVLDNVSIGTFSFGLFRTAVFGGVVALVGYSQGSLEKRDSDQIGKATTSAVVQASLAVITLDFVMTFVASLWK